MVGTLALVKNLDVVMRYKYTFGAIGIVLLMLPIFIGTTISGSKLWIRIAGFTIQPGEFAKIFIVLFLAGYLAENRELLSISNRKILGLKIPRLRLLLPLFAVWGVCLLVVVFERDLGSAVLFYTIFLLMLYVATGRFSYVIIGLALLAVGAVGAYKFLSHVQVRFQIWADPFKDAQGQGYQIVQSLFSLADGGLVGVGIGNGLANNIPVVESDFIFSAIGEEMGLLGGGAVLILFMLFAVRGLTTAARAKSDLAAFSATGLTAAISFQAFLIVGGVTRLIPLTGVTLPFMSQGGSSLLASFIIVALLLRAGDEATGREAELTGTGTMAAITDEQLVSAAAPTGTRFATPSSYNRGGHSTGSRMRRRLLDTPESGVLGRVALANRLTRAVFAFTALFAILIGNLTYVQVFCIILGIVRIFYLHRNRWLYFSALYFAVAYIIDISSDGLLRTYLSGFWYNDFYRVACMYGLCLIPLVTYGLESMINGAEKVYSKAINRKVGTATDKLIHTITLVLFFLICFRQSNLIQLPKAGYSCFDFLSTTVEYQYSLKSPTASLTERGAEFLDKVKAITGTKDLVINDPHDGSVYAYGLKNINTYYRKFFFPNDNTTSDLIRTRLAEISTNKQVREAVKSVKAKYVLVLDNNFDGRSGIRYFDWYRRDEWKGIHNINENTPGFKLVLTEGNMRLYRIDTLN